MAIVVAGGASALSRGASLLMVSAPPCPALSRQFIGKEAPPDVPADSYAIVNNANTITWHVGDGVHRIQKITGAEGTYDAAAVSSVGITGDFVLRIRSIANGANHSGAGMNSDPLTDNDYASIDHLWLLVIDGARNIYESGVAQFSSGDLTYCWIWRIGSTLYYGRGATLAIAAAAPDRSVTDTSTLYFDSAFAGVGGELEAKLYLNGDVVATSALSFAATAAETANAAVTATAPLTFAPAGAETTSATLAGASLLTFTPTGAETAKATAAGTISLSFTPSGAETAKGALGGTTGGLFTGAAGESAGGVLVGSSTIVFSASAAETAKTAAVGASTLAFSQTGTVAASASLTGTAALALTPSGAETAQGTLVSTTALAFGASATLSGSIPLDQIIGAASVAFSNAGNVLAFARLAGSSAFAFGGAGSGTLTPAWNISPLPGTVTIMPSTAPSATVLTIDATSSATPLAVSPSPSAGTFLQDTDPALLEWSA